MNVKNYSDWEKVYEITDDKMSCKLFIFIFSFILLLGLCIFGFYNVTFDSAESDRDIYETAQIDLGKHYKVEFKDPKSVLSEIYGKNIKIIKFESEPLNITGAYFGSSIKEMNITIEEKDGNQKELSLIAKMFPPTDFQRATANSTFTFPKEIFFYKELIPAYEKTLKNSNVKNQTFDFAPKDYGSRLTLKPDFDGVDDDAVLLMENLKTRGYYTGNRNKGLFISFYKDLLKQRSLAEIR